MIRHDFVSNSSSSSFIIDRESFDKATGGDYQGLDYNTYSLYDLCDNNSFYLDIQLGPELWWNDRRLYEFKVIPDKEFVKEFMQYSVSGYIVPESLKHYVNLFKEAYEKYIKREIDSSELYKTVKDPYIKDVIEKVIKPNVTDMELIYVSGSDDEQSDEDYENDEEKVKEICYGVSSYGTKFYRANTAH